MGLGKINYMERKTVREGQLSQGVEVERKSIITDRILGKNRRKGKIASQRTIEAIARKYGEPDEDISHESSSSSQVSDSELSHSHSSF